MTCPYTTSGRLCDDDALVSGEYLDLHNRLRARTDGGCKPTPAPFGCTGSAHLAGVHIQCTSPAHDVIVRWEPDIGGQHVATGT